MPHRTPRTSVVARRLTTALALVVAVLAIAADPLVAATSTPSSGVPPFASGMLTSVNGSTLSVQGTNGATTVAVTDTTTYQQTKTADSSALTVGACARIIGTGSLAKGITAFSVAVTPATANGCTRGRGGFGGGAFGGTRPNGANGNGTSGGSGGRTRFGNGQRPAGAPTGNGNGFGGGTGASNGAVASGTITSVSGDHITAKATTFTRPKKKNAKPKTTTKNVKVTVSDATTITQTVSATVGDLAVGSCVAAVGMPNDTGTLTAVSVTLSAPQNGACTAGFGGGFGGRFGGGAGGGAGGGTGSGTTA